ncbi:MAG: tyrosine-protein phosphatase [Spirochaetes bacterium]|nr:tyrosine-protein phosphatase [Spirochaetota bacterium]
MNINYSEENEITNFREICMGSMKKGVLYRGSYPVFKTDKERDRLYEKLVLEAGIGCVINLAGNADDLEVLARLAPWYNSLLRDNRIIGLGIEFEFDFLDQFQYEVFNYKLRQAFEFLIGHSGPYLVHCNAGVDRTGFVAAIVGLLFGANLDDVIYEYLLSYGENFAQARHLELRHITGRNIYGQINAVVDREIEDSKNLQANIEKYFLKGIGLSKERLEMLKKILGGAPI